MNFVDSFYLTYILCHQEENSMLLRVLDILFESYRSILHFSTPCLVPQGSPVWMAFKAIHVLWLPFVLGQWDSLAEDGERKECEVRAFTLLVLPHRQLCPLLEGFSLVLGSGTLSLCPSLWACSSGSSAAMSSGPLNCSSWFLISCPHLCNKHF